MLDYEVLKKKEELLENASKVLKSELVGIDDIIDGVINNIKSWFLFPELQSRPHVICLFGMTGTGKTVLVKRLCQLLDIESDMVYFNFAEIGENTSFQIESDIEDTLSNERSNRVFVYDEFQYAATLNSSGDEKDKKSGLKPFWELLDEGRLRKRINYWDLKVIYTIARLINLINLRNTMIIENGVWKNAVECLEHFNETERREISNMFDVNDIIFNDETMFNNKEKVGYENKFFFIRYHYVEEIRRIYNQVNEETLDEMDFFHKLSGMGSEEMSDFFLKLYKKSQKGYDLNFSDSIIFVIANLDEAYTMAFNSDPDMSPDQFHKITKDITIVKIKEALQRRFRNEQIARLGNVHMIYPSFSSDSFKKIIRITLEKYASEVKDNTGYILKFKNSIIDFIYNESVFPTHGTRPVFSSVYEIVKSKLPVIVKEIYTNKYDASIIEFSYKGKKTNITLFDNNCNKLTVLKYKEKTRVSNLRDSVCDEEQAIVGVHESGHFTVYAALMGKIPEKLCSRTASSNACGFLMSDYDDNKKLHSYESLLNNIKISLGGYCAEKQVFGKNFMSNGSSNDLREATEIASSLIREYGYVHPVVTTYLQDGGSTNHGRIVRTDNQEEVNKAIYDIIDVCTSQVDKILNDDGWKNLFRESSIYLSENSSMSKKKMTELYNSVPDEYKIKTISDTYYRDMVKSL